MTRLSRPTPSTGPLARSSRCVASGVVALCRIRALGENFAGVLTREVFYRSFDNRRQIASPGSELAEWFRKRVGTLAGRTRRIAIVAMARKLLIALWRYAEIRPESVAAA